MDRLTRGALAVSIGGGMLSLLVAFLPGHDFGPAFVWASVAIPILVWLIYYGACWVWTGKRASYILSGLPLALVVFPAAFVVGALTAEDAVEKAIGISIGGKASWILALACGVAGSVLAWTLSRALLPRSTQEDRG